MPTNLAVPRPLTTVLHRATIALVQTRNLVSSLIYSQLLILSCTFECARGIKFNTTAKIFSFFMLQKQNNNKSCHWSELVLVVDSLKVFTSKQVSQFYLIASLRWFQLIANVISKIEFAFSRGAKRKKLVLLLDLAEKVSDLQRAHFCHNNP